MSGLNTSPTGVQYQTFDNEVDTPVRRNGSNGTANGTSNVSVTYTVDDAIDQIGLGWFQVKIGVICGLAWIADSMEVMALSILGPLLVCDWSISDSAEASITTIVFVGIFIGSPIFGYLGDKYGRKVTLIFSAAWACYFGLLSSFAPTYVWLIMLRSLLGFGVGGIPQVITYFSEFMPQQYRGRLIILQAIPWALGALFEALLAYLIVPSHGWRGWLAATAIPLMLFLVFCFLIPEIPRYFISKGDIGRTLEILQSIAKLNKASLPPGTLSAASSKHNQSKFKDLLKPEYRVTMVLLLLVWFTVAFCYYGLVLMTTELIQVGNTCVQNVGSTTDGECASNCDPLTSKDYIDLMWTSVAEIPGLLLSFFLIDKIGRKWCLILNFSLYSVFMFCLMICMNYTAMMVMLFATRSMISAGFQVVYVYTPEAFPTTIRATALGTCASSARIGAIITPFVAEVLLKQSLTMGFAVYAVLALLSSIAVFFLPERQDKKMDN